MKEQTNKFVPKCIYGNKDLGYSPTGHITPCCWHNQSFDQPYIEDMFSSELHIDNFDCVDDILNTTPWARFFEMLLNNPSDAPIVCYYHCCTTLDSDVEETDRTIIKPDD